MNPIHLIKRTIEDEVISHTQLKKVTKVQIFPATTFKALEKLPKNFVPSEKFFKEFPELYCFAQQMLELDEKNLETNKIYKEHFLL